MSAKHAHDLISAAEVFNILGGVFLPYLNIRFSNWYNAKYGCADLFAHLTAMCKGGASAEGQYRESLEDPKAHSLPSGRWTLGMIRSIPPDQMLVRCTNMIRSTVRKMKKRGMLDGNLHISIDKHLIPRYDKNPDMTNLVKSKHNDGTCNFDCLAVVQGVVDGARAVLGVLRVTRGDLKAELVSRLLDSCRRNGIPLRLLTMDREFFTADIFGLLRRRRIRFIIPATKSPGVRKAIAEFKEKKRGAVSVQLLTPSEGRPEKYALIILERKNKRGKTVYHTFATNAPPAEVSLDPPGFVEEYRQRWGVETGLRCYEQIRPRTTNRNDSVRTMLLLFPIVLYNGWILARYLAVKPNSGEGSTTLAIFVMRILRLAEAWSTIEAQKPNRGRLPGRSPRRTLRMPPDPGGQLIQLAAGCA